MTVELVTQVVCRSTAVPNRCGALRRQPPVSQVYRFDGRAFRLLVSADFAMPSVPLRYDRRQRSMLRANRDAAMVPTRIPVDWIAGIPSVKTFSFDGVRYIGVSIGYGRTCDGATACTNANLSAGRGTIEACGSRAAKHRASSSAPNSSRRTPVRTREGSRAWFARYPCGANCEDSDDLFHPGRRGSVHQIAASRSGSID